MGNVLIQVYSRVIQLHIYAYILFVRFFSLIAYYKILNTVLHALL